MFRWGFACLNKNNERNLKHCSDYKVRYCCGNVKHSYWNPWSEWSPCTKTCGTGTSTRKHTCKNQAAADCIGQKTQERECNRAHCPGILKLHCCFETTHNNIIIIPESNGI